MRQGHQADAITEHTGLAHTVYMNQLTGRVSDLQHRAGGAEAEAVREATAVREAAAWVE